MDTIEPIYKELAARITKEKNQTLPKVLKKAVNLDQAKLLAELPNTTEEIAKNLGMDVETVSKEMQTLFEIGVAMKGRKDGTWSTISFWSKI